MLTILFVFTLASDMAVLYENDAFSILVLPIKKRYSSFLKNVFVFQKICFKVNVLKALKTSNQCYVNANLSKGRLFWKSLVPVLEELMLFLLALKWNLWEKVSSSVMRKNNSNFAVKLAKRSNHLSLLSI